MNRPGRPEMTKAEQDAMTRLAKDPDGRVFLGRLGRIKRHKQDEDMAVTDHAVSLLTKGAVQELDALLREFQEAVEADKPQSRPDRQKRF